MNDVISKAGKYQTRHEPTFYYPSSVKSEATWLRLKELEFEAKNKYLTYFCKIYRQINEVQHVCEDINFAQFLRFQANLHLQFG